MYVTAMLGDTFPRDPVCLPPTSCPPLSPAFLNSFVKSGDPPYFLPRFSCTYEIGWEGTFHVLKLSLGTVGGQGRVPHPRPRPGLPFPCFLQPHPGILPAPKGPWTRITRAEAVGSNLAAVTYFTCYKLVSASFQLSSRL